MIGDHCETRAGSLACVAAKANLRKAQVKGALLPGRSHNTGDSRTDEVAIT